MLGWGAFGLVPSERRRPASTPKVVRMRYGLAPEQPEEATIRVRMQRTTRATLDGGRTTNTYEEGRDYDLPEWLAEAFFKGGEADPAEAHEQPGDRAISEAAESTDEPALSPAPRRTRRPSLAKSQG